MVCLSHGSNDVANAISPLIVVMEIEGKQKSSSFTIGAFGIALGLIVYGKNVIENIGKNVIKLDFYKGYAALFSTASCVCIGSSLGLPLSTTHCMIGALGGIHLAA